MKFLSKEMLPNILLTFTGTLIMLGGNSLFIWGMRLALNEGRTPEGSSMMQAGLMATTLGILFFQIIFIAFQSRTSIIQAEIMSRQTDLMILEVKNSIKQTKIASAQQKQQGRLQTQSQSRKIRSSKLK